MRNVQDFIYTHQTAHLFLHSWSKVSMFTQCMICRFGFNILLNHTGMPHLTLRSTKTWFNRDALTLIIKGFESHILRYLTLCVCVCVIEFGLPSSQTCLGRIWFVDEIHIRLCNDINDLIVLFYLISM